MIVLVPARKGSKGVPGKNKKMLAGKPLIQHTIEQALQTPEVDSVYVSTDDDDIIDLVNSIEGASAPFKRPAILADDNSTSVDVYIHFADWWRENKGEELKDLIVLLPTSPLRKPQDISAAIRIFKDKNAKVVLTFKETKPIAWHRYIDQDGNITKILDIDEKASIVNRQEISETPYVLNGSIYIFKMKELRETKSYFGEGTYPYIMPSSRSIDIDSPDDFRLAEAILNIRE